MFPAKGPSTEGPRLGDLSVSSSAYGMPIPIIYGTMRVSGNMIWSTGLSEVKQKQKVGKGGGGSQTTYTYYASFAVAFGEGPADDVLRIWADSKLIYDKTDTTANTTKAGLKFRFHPGNETQLPDPLIEADVGAGRAPAHRGLCVIVFEELPLADFGNRIPNINAEITYNKITQQSFTYLDYLTSDEGGLLSGYQVNELTVDWVRGYGYFATKIGTNDTTGIRRFNLATMKEDRQASMTHMVNAPDNGPDTIFAGDDGYLYFTHGNSNCRPIIRVEPTTMREVGRFGVQSSSLSNSSTRFVAARFFAFLMLYTPTARVDYLVVGSVFGRIGIVKVSDMSYLWGANQAVGAAAVVGGAVARGYGDAWVLGSSISTLGHTQYDLYRLRVWGTAMVDPITGETHGVDRLKIATIQPWDIEPGATGYNDVGGLSYDRSDDSVIFMVRIAGCDNSYVLKWREDLGIVWKTLVPTMINYDGHWFGKARLDSGKMTFMRMSRIYRVDTATGELVSNEHWPEIAWEQGAQVYDGVTDTLIVHTQSGWAKVYLGRGSGAGDTLAAIVADLSLHPGLVEAGISVAELTDIVPGYVIGRQTTVRGAIAPLSQAYFFDGVEIDYQLRYLKRGRAPVATIPAASLVPMSGEESWRERRTQEVDLPERVSVISLNHQMDYQQAVQSEKRIALPTPAMHSRNQTAIELAIALDATTAKRIAAKMLTLAWIERAGYECVLPPPWLRLDPTDVITVTFPGASFRSRTLRIDTGADFTLSMKGVSDSVAAYTSTLQADGGRGLPVQTITTSVVTFLILPDVPLLRDVDDTAGIGSRVYFAGGGYGEPGWRGAVLYRSADGSSWTSAGAIVAEAAYGIAMNALGAPVRSAFCTDEDNELVVLMTTGGDELESVTQEVMLSGTANAALLLKANGEPEIIQFRDVSYDPLAGSYTLSGLLRGRRGTDVFTSGHAVGELFVLLDAETFGATTLELADLDLTRQWRAVTLGSLFEDAEIQPRVLTGRDLQPYAPWDVRAAAAGSDIILSWSRRTRIGGELKDETGDVPLGEAFETYEIDILAEPGGAVLRTLESTSESATYGAADITTDFGATPATLSVVVTQLSAVIGRGFPRAVTVEIS